MLSFYTQATYTILFQTHANQLIRGSVFSRLSLFGTKRNSNTNNLNKETYLYHSFCKSLHLRQLPNHARSKTSWARKMAVFWASGVLLLHDIPFEMPITTADQSLTNRRPTADQPLTNSFSLLCRELILFCCKWILFCRDSCGPPSDKKYIFKQKTR